MPDAEEMRRLELVVLPAKEPDIPQFRAPAVGVGLNMVELERAAFRATLPHCIHERATSLVALPHRAPYGRGDVTRTRFRRRPWRLR